jgi:hypothetical protein
MLTWGLFVGMAGLVRMYYFADGHARLPYGLYSLAALGFGIFCFAIAGRMIPNKTTFSRLKPNRQRFLSKGIEIEIAERLTEKHANCNDT